MLARCVGDSQTPNHNGRARIDSGLFLARSFRVGWGPNGELVHGGVALSPPRSITEQSKPRAPLPPQMLASSEVKGDLNPPGRGSGLGYVVHLERVRVGQLKCVGSWSRDEAGSEQAAPSPNGENVT